MPCRMPCINRLNMMVFPAAPTVWSSRVLTTVFRLLRRGKAKGEFWGLVKAGWRFWPLVSLVNYVFLTSVEARSLVGALAGLGWGIYLSLMTG